MRKHALSRLGAGLLGLGLGLQIAVAEVTYQLDFVGTWSSATHPGAFPGGSAHFTDLVGGTHSDAVSFWKAGELATTGIENVAELGSTSVFLGEVQAAINAGTAESKILGPDLFGLPASDSITFNVSASHPLVTLASMIAPSPDWFVGVSGLSLRENEQWRGRVEVDLVAYDAGTEEGVGFSLLNPETSPQEAIAKLTDGPLVGLPPLGLLSLVVQPNGLPGDFDLNGLVDGDDLRNWESGFGNFSDGSATVVDGDANEDGFVNGADFLLWQKNKGTSLTGTTAAQAVPEAGSTVLFLVGWAVLVALSFRRKPLPVVASSPSRIGERKRSVSE